MAITVSDLAAALGASHAGDGSLPVGRPAPPEAAGPGDLALAMEPKHAATLAGRGVQVAVLPEGADWRALGLVAAIFVARPRYALAGLTAAFDRPPAVAPGIHALAAVDPSAEIGEGAAIGAFVSIGPGVQIGPRARILPHASVAEEAEIGADALIHEGVRIGRRVRIGARVILQPNAVIGGDGFSFVTPEKGAVEEARARGAVTEAARRQGLLRIQSIGSVTLGDDVEVGAGSCIDRGTIADTVVGSGTKIDNLVQVGHNVRIGAGCMICGQVGLAGSVQIGDRVVIGGQAGIADHIRVGHDVLVAAGSKVATHVAPRSIVMGMPAMPRDKATELVVLTRRLPALFAEVAALTKRVSKSDPTG